MYQPCNRRSVWVFLSVCLLWFGVSSGQESKPQVASMPLVKSTYVYKKVGDVAISADVYRPAGTESRPVVVWIHGGALIVGSRNQVPRNILEMCTQERFVFVSLDYRLAPEVKLPEISNDIQDAFKWLHEQGPKLFQADTSRIVVTGGSAGGFLTMLSGVVVKPRPSALVAYWGYGDIDAKWATDSSDHYRTKTPLIDPKTAVAAVQQGKVLTNTDDPTTQKARGDYYRYLRQSGGWSREVTGIDAAKEPGKLKPYCPVQLITPEYPPIMMIHGTADTDVPYECSAKMDAELTRHGVEHVLATIPGAEHGLRDGDPKLVAVANSKALEFIRRHLVSKASKVGATAPSERVTVLLATISHAGPQGAGSEAARSAKNELAKCGLEIIPQLLMAMDTPNIVAANWYRAVFEDLISREQSRTDVTWPMETFKDYVNDAQRAGRPRRRVLALIDKLEPGFSVRWLPTRLDDPEFRHEAVGLAIAAGEQSLSTKDQVAAKQRFQQAFEHARDSSQVVHAASKLKSLGGTADTVEHLGLVVDWWLVGPFDAPGKTGFAKAFEPERDSNLKTRYAGPDGAEIGWIPHHTNDSLGQVNLIGVFGSIREAVAFASSEIEVPQAGPAYLGCGADDNCTVWLNGEKVLAREQWLNGTRFDRFVTPVQLKLGRNQLLVKICQGPQHKDPEVPNNWSLQLRLCDKQGRGIGFKPVLPQVIQ
ncbi:MAG: hypothetical protein JWM11_1240 [Planctomycetaceae bacterium]|nr:hypothetical protein [Planctomycetaceae bacterium]